MHKVFEKSNTLCIFRKDSFGIIIYLYISKNSEYLHEIYYNYHKIIKEWRIL